MYNVKNLNIWKKEEPKPDTNGLRSVDITEMSLSVRSFNCLKRANCNTVGDILDLMDEEGNGLRRIRNLGTRSEKEIRDAVENLRVEYSQRAGSEEKPSRFLIKPAKVTLSRPVDDFSLSGRTRNALHSSGIYYVQDLYSDDVRQEPGWFAVRELFEQILRK